MNTGMIPQYFIDKKEKFLQQAAQIGFDLYMCQDFLEQKGICEQQINTLLDNIQNPTYINVLRHQIMPQGGFPPGPG